MEIKFKHEDENRKPFERQTISDILHGVLSVIRLQEKLNFPIEYLFNYDHTAEWLEF